MGFRFVKKSAEGPRGARDFANCEGTFEEVKRSLHFSFARWYFIGLVCRKDGSEF